MSRERAQHPLGALGDRRVGDLVADGAPSPRGQVVVEGLGHGLVDGAHVVEAGCRSQCVVASRGDDGLDDRLLGDGRSGRRARQTGEEGGEVGGGEPVLSRELTAERRDRGDPGAVTVEVLFHACAGVVDGAAGEVGQLAVVE